MSRYLSEVRKLENHFFGFEVQYIPRKDNFLADQLARMVSSRSTVPKGVFLEQLQKPSLVDEPETPPIDTASLEYEDTWMAPIYEYLQKGSVPEDDLEADRISRLALWGTGLGYRDPRSQKAKTEVLFVMPEPVGVFACYETGIVHMS